MNDTSVVEGSEAVALAVKGCRPQVISAYPISPQTHIVETLARMVANGELDEAALATPAEAAAACVVAAAADYPRSGAKGQTITGIEEARAAGALVFHAGTKLADGGLQASGGRVLNLVGTGDSLDEALGRAYAGMERVSFEGMRYRRDIGWRALARGGEPLSAEKETR